MKSFIDYFFVIKVEYVYFNKWKKIHKSLENKIHLKSYHSEVNTQ